MEPSCLTNFFQLEYEADFPIFLSLPQPCEDFDGYIKNDLNIPVMSLI